jgi:hypothetical protein
MTFIAPVLPPDLPGDKKKILLFNCGFRKVIARCKMRKRATCPRTSLPGSIRLQYGTGATGDRLRISR